MSCLILTIKNGALCGIRISNCDNEKKATSKCRKNILIESPCDKNKSDHSQKCGYNYKICNFYGENGTHTHFYHCPRYAIPRTDLPKSLFTQHNIKTRDKALCFLVMGNVMYVKYTVVKLIQSVMYNLAM